MKNNKYLTVPAKGGGKFDRRMSTGIGGGKYAPLKKGKGPPHKKMGKSSQGY